MATVPLKKPIIVAVPAGKKAGDTIKARSPTGKEFTAVVPKMFTEGMGFYVTVDESAPGVPKAKPLMRVFATPLPHTTPISCVSVKVPNGRKPGDKIGPYASPSGRTFTVKIPKGFKQGEDVTVTIQEDRKDTQEATPLQKGQFLEYVTVPAGKKEKDFLGPQLTPTCHEFLAYVPKGATPGTKIPYLVLDKPPEGCTGCFQKICGFYS
eukprot:TRINITY_DN162_c0_g2_i1.p1 TRINITY_DN162_c0_g2~~TRINITY_DN162_c0_g2_i1.p1  ORF type:complete len:209 (-),score=30.38 TRINITY_DN162_c0_g2_i1:101-727(-)